MHEASNLFERSIKRWGFNSQVLMLAEESSELTQATLHLLRNAKQKEALQNLAEEIADVEFMLEEMKYIIPDLEQMVIYWRHKKEDRLRKMLDIAGG